MTATRHITSCAGHLHQNCNCNFIQSIWNLNTRSLQLHSNGRLIRHNTKLWVYVGNIVVITNKNHAILNYHTYDTICNIFRSARRTSPVKSMMTKSNALMKRSWCSRTHFIDMRSHRNLMLIQLPIKHRSSGTLLLLVLGLGLKAKFCSLGLKAGLANVALALEV